MAETNLSGQHRILLKNRRFLGFFDFGGEDLASREQKKNDWYRMRMPLEGQMNGQANQFSTLKIK